MSALEYIGGWGERKDLMRLHEHTEKCKIVMSNSNKIKNMQCFDGTNEMLNRNKIERQQNQNNQKYNPLSPLPGATLGAPGGCARGPFGGARGAALWGNFDSRFLPFFLASPFCKGDFSGMEGVVVDVAVKCADGK